MRVLVSGACGFAGSALIRGIAEAGVSTEIVGFDNFSRPGSETNRADLKRLGVKLFHADLRAASDLEALPDCDWAIDAAANPSVLAGVDGAASSRQLVEHNLAGTINLLEHCKSRRCGFILLSTSRVYGIAPLSALPLEESAGAFRPAKGAHPRGIDERFPTLCPLSLYGATKLASETLALEYGEAFGLPVFINRCGILAGAGQFGRADQGIFAFWINRWLRRAPLTYIGFGGTGLQTRDCLHPRDLLPLLRKQFAAPRLPAEDRIVNAGGGAASATSLKQLSAWCAAKFGPREVGADPQTRRFDVPWLVLDCGKAERLWDWRPRTPVGAILDEIAAHAEAHPGWLETSAPF